MPKLVILLCFCIISLHAFPQDENPNDKKLIQQTLVDMWAAIEEGNLEAYAAFLHPNYTAFGESEEKLLVGKENEVEAVRNWLLTASNIQTKMIDPRISIRGQVAWISYYWSDKGIDQGKEFSSKGKSTRIFVKENGKWLCIHAHFTLL